MTATPVKAWREVMGQMSGSPAESSSSRCSNRNVRLPRHARDTQRNNTRTHYYSDISTTAPVNTQGPGGFVCGGEREIVCVEGRSPDGTPGSVILA